MKARKILIYIFSLFIISVITTFIFGWPYITLYNDYQTNEFLKNAKQIVTISKDSKIVNEYKRYGILFGNGNHCDCEVSILVETNIEIDEFEKQINENLLSDLPFTDINNSLFSLYLVKDYQIFFKHKNDTIELNPNYNHPFDGFDRHTYQNLLTMIENIIQKSDKNYFIASFTKQIYTGYRTKDYRCH